MKRVAAGILAITTLLTLSSCARGYDEYIDSTPIAVIEEEAVALANSPAMTVTGICPQASGVKTKEANKAIIDYSNATDGYVMTQYKGATDKRLKVQVVGPSKTTYTYNLPASSWASFPLSDGNGSYKITVYQNVNGSKYSALVSLTQNFDMKNEFTPFLASNQYVNFTSAPNAVAKAKELTKGLPDPLKKVEKVYNFVVTTLTYDKDKAKTVQSGYLPVLDTVLSSKKGICFDYAALMAGMLRSQGVPCKLVVGYAGTAYHAWISVYTDEYGWINGAIYFDGENWQRMDPTFASSGKQSKTIMAYIGDGKNYQSKYFY